MRPAADSLPRVVSTNVDNGVVVRFLKLVAIAAALLIVPQIISGPIARMGLPVVDGIHEDRLRVYLTFLGVAALISRRALRKNDFNPHHVTRLTTNWVYFIAFAGMVAMGKQGNFSAGPWYMLAGAVTVCLIWRTVAQERWLRDLDDSGERVRARKTGSFSAALFARGNNPAFFRWTTRVLALAWVWTTIPQLVNADPSSNHDNLAFLLMPACFLLIGGMAAAAIMVPVFPFVLLFAASGPGAFWWLTLLAWLVYTALLRPHDRRTNFHSALMSFERGAAWNSAH